MPPSLSKPADTTTATTPPVQELTSISQLLHLTHHRNKNQHRLAKWYKPFSQLRRQVGKLIPEVAAFETAEKFSAAEGGEGRYVKAARERLERRVRFLRARVVGKCFLAFSNVVADQQYAVLGLFLVATLARLQAVMNQWSAVEGDEEEEEAEEQQGEEPMESVSENTPANEPDLGEVVAREVVVEDDGIVITPKPEDKSRARDVSGLVGGGKQTKKKRKKGGDAFDDLFAGLL